MSIPYPWKELMSIGDELDRLGPETKDAVL